MKHHTFKYLLLLALLSCSLGLKAQWRKPLASNKGIGAYTDAKINVGIVVGPTATAWFHTNSKDSDLWYIKTKDYNILPSYGIYKDKTHKDSIVMCYQAGIAVEYMATPTFSLGIQGIYSKRATGLYYKNDHFPTGIGQWSTKEYTLSAIYSSVDLFIPLTYYIKIPTTNVFMPYFMAGPQFSYVLKGDFYYDKTVDGKPSLQKTGFGNNTYKRFNVGATVGLGIQFRIETGSYYNLMKFDIIGNYNTLQTFTHQDLKNEFNNKRYSFDAEVRFTYMFPIKKVLRDACHGFNGSNR